MKLTRKIYPFLFSLIVLLSFSFILTNISFGQESVGADSDQVEENGRAQTLVEGVEAEKEPKHQVFSLSLSSSINIEQVLPSSFYYVFSPADVQNDGGYCALVPGYELRDFSSDLRQYGTCFINDTGLFEIIEMKEQISGNYSTVKGSEFFVVSKTLEITQ